MTNPAVCVTAVTKRFGPTTALDGIDLSMPEGSVFGLLGPNGSGKTTLVRILTNILSPDSGHATVLGFDVARQPSLVRLNIGLAGQAAAVDENLTGAENLALIGRLAQIPRRDVPIRVDELLERFQLVDAARRPVRTYSGGMRRRLDIAASLMQRPPVLFLDEPTTGLDPHSRTTLWDMVRDLVTDGTTVLLTTQYLEEADHLADHLAVIDNGSVIARGTPSELKARLGTTIIELGFQNTQLATQARDCLTARTATRPDQDGETLRLASAEGSRILVEVLHALDTAHRPPHSIVVREPSLDDVFLTLTGHRSDDATAENLCDQADVDRAPSASGTP